MKILLVVYDNDAFLHFFPIGLGYIAQILRQEGHEIKIWNQDVHHYQDEELTAYLDEETFDLVGVSLIAGYYQYQRLLGLSAAINHSKSRPTYLLGGYGPSPDPEFFLKKTEADFIIIGEGEETVLELIHAIAAKAGTDQYRQIRGIAFRHGDEVTINPRRALIQDIDAIPFPAYDLFPMEYYRMLRMPHCDNRDFVHTMMSGRGCTFTCNFCFRLDTGFRPRSPESIIEEIQLLKRDYRINYISFVDDLLMTSVARTEAICKAFIKAKLNIKWNCNGRLNYAKPDLLQLMKESGCVFINYGIEAVDDVALKTMKKALTVKIITRGIEATLAAGISPGYNIIWGNIDETKETLQKGVDFLLKYDNHSQLRTIRPVTPYPGSPLFFHAIQNGLLKDTEDFYENKHLNSDLLAVNFTNLTDDEFHEALCEANKSLIGNHYNNLLSRVIKQTDDLYKNKDITFRGYRHT